MCVTSVVSQISVLLYDIIIMMISSTPLDDAFHLSQEKTKNLTSFSNAFLSTSSASTVFC